MTLWISYKRCIHIHFQSICIPIGQFSKLYLVLLSLLSIVQIFFLIVKTRPVTCENQDKLLWKRLLRTFSLLHHSYYTHCEKCVRSRSYSGPHFPAFELNAERYPIFCPNAGKMRTRITPNTDTFYSVTCFRAYKKELVAPIYKVLDTP